MAHRFTYHLSDTNALKNNITTAINSYRLNIGKILIITPKSYLRKTRKNPANPQSYQYKIQIATKKILNSIQH